MSISPVCQFVTNPCFPFHAVYTGVTALTGLIRGVCGRRGSLDDETIHRDTRADSASGITMVIVGKDGVLQISKSLSAQDCCK